MLNLRLAKVFDSRTSLRLRRRLTHSSIWLPWAESVRALLAVRAAHIKEAVAMAH